MELKLWTFDFSPYCLPLTRLLEAGQIPFQEIVLNPWDRRLVIEATQGAYAHVPLLQIGETFYYESGQDTQDVARAIDRHFFLNQLFPSSQDGLQELMCRHLEDQVEFHAFRLNDIHRIPLMEDWVGKKLLVLYKERKFGQGCLDRWRAEESSIMASLVHALSPYEKILSNQPFLLDLQRPLFADFLLYGMLANLTFGGHQEVPEDLPHVRGFFQRLKTYRF